MARFYGILGFGTIWSRVITIDRQNIVMIPAEWEASWIIPKYGIDYAVGDVKSGIFFL